MARILIIEDDASTAEQLQSYLTAAGHECTLEMGGESALATARETEHDLLLLDIMLPGVSGFEVCRRVRRDAELYTMPILVLSAMNSEEEVLHGLAQGADDYVAKPFRMQDLVKRVEALLQTSAERQGIDTLTSLPGAASSKREIQRRVSRRNTFALAACEIIGLREFSRKYGDDARGKAIRHLARALQHGGEQFEEDAFFVGHMGGGYFVCVLPVKVAKNYCEWAREAWHKHLGVLYEAIGKAGAMPSTARQEGEIVLDLLFCVARKARGDHVTSQQLFETLSQIRHTVVSSKTGGVHFDRRSVLANQ